MIVPVKCKDDAGNKIDVYVNSARVMIVKPGQRADEWMIAFDGLDRAFVTIDEPVADVIARLNG